MNRTQDWLEQAKHDLAHARQSIGLEHFAWSCFAAQQAAEKAVKALHLHLGTVAWGHSVFELLDGLRSRSRAPHHVHNRTPYHVEAAIVRLRKLILSGGDPELRYANIGADALAYELKRAGITPPSRATINRILKRRDLVRPRRRKRKKRKLPDDYPWPRVEAPNDLHLFDFITRSIRGEGRFYGCNLLDQARRWAFLRAETPKSADVVSQFLISAWQEVG